MSATGSRTTPPTVAANPAGPRAGSPGRAVPAWLRGLAAVPDARWAALSLGFFVSGVVADLLGAPRWLPALLYAVCYLAGGWEPTRSGLAALRNRSLDVDLLMIVAAIGAAAIGQVFDGALLIVIFATSGALEAWATARTEDAVRGLLELSPDQVTRIDRDGRETVVATVELEVGDTILVRPGEAVGADGVVIDGASDVDQAGVTGEPLPTARQAGDEVFAGTVNGVGALTVRVTREAGESVVARIAALVEQAAETKAHRQLFIEKVEQRYSVGVVAATLAVFLLPLGFGADVSAALLRAMTFMIVASPCAIVLATMPPLLAAIATAGRRGVLVKSALVMEQIGDVDAVVIDKTGTLTRGTPRLAAVHLLDDSRPGSWDTDTVLEFAAAAESVSEHPLARAVLTAAGERELAVGEAEEFTSTPGRGVRAHVRGRLVEVGSPGRLLDHDPPRRTIEAIETVENAGHTAVAVLVDRQPVAVLAIADELRPDAAATVAALCERTGTSPVLLTGDNPRTAGAVAAAVGITETHALLLPEDKVALIEDLRARGHRVLAVGDGVNDAPALATADVGVAMGRGGADLTLHAAGVVVAGDELPSLPALLDLARRARRTVVTNLAVAATFIAVLVVWDLVGHLPLPLGVAGHEGSTVLVGLNGLRLLRASSGGPRRPPPTS